MTVNLQPKEAVDQGAAWRVVETRSPFTNAATAGTDLVTELDYTIEFRIVPGWITPTNFPVNLLSGQDAVLTVTYERAMSVLAASQQGIFVSGPLGKVAQIEFTTRLGSTASWTNVQSIPLGTSPVRVIGPPWTNGQAGFYRARTVE